MGLGLFVEGEGPKFERPVRDEKRFWRSVSPMLAPNWRMMDAVSSIRRAQGRVPLIGFSGSPWTLACYMVEGGGSDDFRRVKPWLMIGLIYRTIYYQ